VFELPLSLLQLFSKRRMTSWAEVVNESETIAFSI